MLSGNQYFIKLVIVLISIIPSVINIENQQISFFIFYLLLYLLNIRLRKIITVKQFLIVSLFCDFIIIYIMFNTFNGLIYLLTLIIIIDGIVCIENYNYGILIVSSLFMMYLIKDMELEIILLALFTVCYIFLFTHSITLKNKKIAEIEYLYDDVRRYSYELEKAKKQVELYSSKVEKLTQMQERARISTEIHDTIGHRLTALLLQMEAGVRLLENNKEKSKELLQASVENLRESIDILRKTVMSIKPKEHKEIIFSIKEMINKFKSNTDINVTLNINGNPIKLYPGAELVLYKNTQEALTNAARHSKAENIIINLAYTDKEVLATIANDGFISRDIKKGLGITAMEERLSFIGGRLNIYTNDKFIIENIIPIKDI